MSVSDRPLNSDLIENDKDQKSKYEEQESEIQHSNNEELCVINNNYP